jgi:signal transduction histidine kinase
LFNLIENALKQNPFKDLKIEVGAEDVDKYVRIWVSDNGVGIPSADLPHIFRRFYRVEKHHSQMEIKGTGLGLSIVKRAIEAHQGTITVSSTPGRETKFLMTIPKEKV